MFIAVITIFWYSKKVEFGKHKKYF